MSDRPATRVRVTRVVAGLLALAIVALSVVPPGLRPVVAGQDTEHLLAFLALGASVGLAYPGRWLAATFALFVFAGGVELVQLCAPGRHARLEDFVVDFLGSLVGLLLVAVCAFVASRLAPRARPTPAAEVSEAANATG